MTASAFGMTASTFGMAASKFGMTASRCGGTASTFGMTASILGAASRITATLRRSAAVSKPAATCIGNELREVGVSPTLTREPVAGFDRGALAQVAAGFEPAAERRSVDVMRDARTQQRVLRVDLWRFVPRQRTTLCGWTLLPTHDVREMPESHDGLAAIKSPQPPLDNCEHSCDHGSHSGRWFMLGKMSNWIVALRHIRALALVALAMGA